MLDNLLYSINAIFPIFLIVILGAILGKCKKLTPQFTEAADWLVFKIALPVIAVFGGCGKPTGREH